MKNRSLFGTLALTGAAMLMAACASSPEATPAPAAAPSKAAVQGSGKSMETAMAEAAKGYTQVEQNGETMFCKRYRKTGSNLTTMNCITEAQLREQVENARKFGEDRMQQGRRCSNGPACQPD